MWYKVGEKVRVRQWKPMAREFGTNEWGEIKTPRYYFGREKENFCGQIVTILEEIDIQNCYKITEDGGYWRWTDNMFEGYAFEYGDEIFVSNDAENWVKRIYIGYLDGAKKPYACTKDIENFRSGKEFEVELWKYASPQEKVFAALSTGLVKIKSE